MNYRNVTIHAEETLLTKGTKVIPINVKDKISRITIFWQVLMAAHGMDSYPHSDITKIELVDGSDVLFSMDGGECQALCIYDRKCEGMNGDFWMNGVNTVATFGIDFGRFLHDPLLALDPTLFRNPQLKITYNVALMDTGATYGYLSVFADVFDEKVISPVGFLMSKEVWSAVKPTAGYEAIDLPTDFPYRKLLLKSYKVAYEPYNMIDEVRLDEDNQKRIPFDVNLEDYYHIMKGIWSPVVSRVYGVCHSGGTYAFYVEATTEAPIVSMIAVGEGYLKTESPPRGGKLSPYPTEAQPFFQAIVSGYLPNHCVEFPFGDPKDIDDWYDVTKVGNLSLRLHAGTDQDVTDCGVVLQQLRRY